MNARINSISDAGRTLLSEEAISDSIDCVCLEGLTFKFDFHGGLVYASIRGSVASFITRLLLS